MNQETNEILKSTLIGIVALITLICWLVYQPHLPDVKPKEKIGQKLLDSFNDVSKMNRLEFSRINPKTGELESLILIRDKKNLQWTIPSLSNFPAENAEEIAKVVAPLMQLTILDVVDETLASSELSKTERLHRECGLLNPFSYIALDQESNSEEEEPNLSVGSALSVKIEGENNDVLVDLLIGSRISESSETRDDRYVRFSNDDVVYIVDFSGDSTQEIGTTEFTEYTNRVSFEPIDWVDRDLLRISRWDVLYLTLRDYTFSLVKTDSGFEQTKIQQNGVAIFKQTPENSLSRIWSLNKLFQYDGKWTENREFNVESVQNDVLNDTIDVLGSMEILDVRKKPESLRNCFLRNEIGSELATQDVPLGEFGFSFFDEDPLDLQKITPILVGEGGTIELVLKSGMKIILIFGKNFDDRRACLAYATFDSQYLEENTEDESEIAFLSQDVKKKVSVKNQRFANWFYLISEEVYQTISISLSKTIK